MIDMNDDRSENVKYDYSDFPVYIRKDLLSVFPHYTADSHWHDDIELIAVLSGQMLYHVNGEIVTLNKGEGIFINARQFHYGFSQTETECEFICILFHPLLLCTVKSFEIEYVKPLLNSGRSYLHLSPAVPWQNNMLKCVKNIWEKKEEPGAPLVIQSFLCLLWSEMIAHTCLTGGSQRMDLKLITLKKMISYIHENYREKITLTAIAGAGNVSKRTCGMIFLEYQNKTPIEFLMDYRLRKGIELMKHTDMTILEISLSVGFSGASYFSESFRRHFGKTPTEYRKNCQKQQ